MTTYKNSNFSPSDSGRKDRVNKEHNVHSHCLQDDAFLLLNFYSCAAFKYLIIIIVMLKYV